ncbi:SAM-dependent methyltransferase [Streptomyces sp. Amel2xC10]|uniref:SAM-dependent methyltransferase n=1 Tax=Streptomyces sp. Amel2xC10 TaxID=1305826 RepID=UPI000A08FBD9|nr:SAM-dependent methyltransferase [Streptomyces sp. Amel2xC10]SMF85364.1 SAM-dependent methyltransferase, MidA family [Streptomyces sp. Amel2xC10]
MVRDGTGSGGWRGWRAATRSALYGTDGEGGSGTSDSGAGDSGTGASGAGGFYRRPEGPAGHFRTSVHASPLFATAVARLLCRVDEALGRPETLDFVDMAAGRGELVTGVLAALPADVAARTRAYAVEIAGRPEGLARRITWLSAPPPQVTGLLFANEWLDNVPVEVAEVDPAGVPRLVLVRDDGTERLGDPLSGAEAEWLARWWPLPAEEGLRAEIGLPRDLAWAAAVSCVARGLAVAVDYGHTADARPPFGTLTGFREGRETAPVPDGSCDITAHVALDACATAGADAPGPTPLLTQRAALRALGITGARPPLALAGTDPAAYVRALAGAGEAAELTAPGGLGDFAWLLQPVGIANPLPREPV